LVQQTVSLVAPNEEQKSPGHHRPGLLALMRVFDVDLVAEGEPRNIFTLVRLA
jgi:hypothetical protein